MSCPGASAHRAEGRHQLPDFGIAAAIAETGHLRSRAALLRGIWRPCIAIVEGRRCPLLDLALSFTVSTLPKLLYVFLQKLCIHIFLRKNKLIFKFVIGNT